MPIPLYAALGARLIRFELDAEAASLARREELTLPQGVQYAWRHGRLPFLYAGCSDGGLGLAGTAHCLVALRVGPGGRLAIHGQALPLPWRPVHVSVDRDSRFLLVAFNDPGMVKVFRLADDGAIGEEVPQPELQFGRTVHQVRVTPDNDRVVVPVRGTDAENGRGEDPGSLEVFDFRDGRLVHQQSIAPGGGFGFGPRHVDFHPARPWMYLAIERQNEVALFDLGPPVAGPRVRATTLVRPHEEKPRQLVGAIHVHPGGRFVYVSNRADGTVDDDGKKVFNGGENTLAVFELGADGVPRRIQAEDTRGIHVRTFTIDPTGQVLVAANMRTRAVKAAGGVRDVPGGLSIFRIARDGTLAFQRKVDLDVTAANLFWVGL